MAQRVITQLVDDMDGTDLGAGKGETVQFGLDGKAYEIDLSNKNAKTLRDALAKYVAVARRVQGSGRSGSRRSVAASSDAKDIRAWAQSQDMKVPDRGRIPGDVRQAYENR